VSARIEAYPTKRVEFLRQVLRKMIYDGEDKAENGSKPFPKACGGQSLMGILTV
jgi:hypothetical protein